MTERVVKVTESVIERGPDHRVARVVTTEYLPPPGPPAEDDGPLMLTEADVSCYSPEERLERVAGADAPFTDDAPDDEFPGPAEGE